MIQNDKDEIHRDIALPSIDALLAVDKPYLSSHLSDMNISANKQYTMNTLSRPSGSYPQLPSLDTIIPLVSRELVSIPYGFSTQAVEKDINEIIEQCKSLGRHMDEKRGGFFCQSESEKPWLNDMIGKANQILNALLRLRKQQLAMDNNTLTFHNDLTHSDPKMSTISKTRKRVVS
ncbi:unnamed protein product [Rhizopus stolonifer]